MAMPSTESQDKIFAAGRSTPEGKPAKAVYLKGLDYSIVQQCMHCGMCLPTCPTYDATRLERNSPRGRIALMRAIADEQLPLTPAFGQEMYFCLGCLACETACPAGVKYAQLFEFARADIEHSGVLANPRRNAIRAVLLKGIFTRPQLLRSLGWGLWIYQVSGLEWAIRRAGLTRLLPTRLRELEKLTPRVRFPFSDKRIAAFEAPKSSPATKRYRVGLLTGCVQDLVYSEINRDTVDVLLANGCEVVTPRSQSCCGSLHAHNGELETAKEMARRQLNAFDLEHLDAVISNAAGCGSHLKTYGHLLADDPEHAERARLWDQKIRDIHEWLAEIGIRVPRESASQVSGTKGPVRVAYHEACHLCHAQKITRQPRELLQAIPGLELVELPESNWCCGSAGIYNITQPEMSAQLLERKVGHIAKTGVEIVATSNPGCMIQLASGLASHTVAQESSGQLCKPVSVQHTLTLLAQAYRAEAADAG